MNSSKQLKLGAIFSYVQMGLNILIGIVYTPIMIRVLGQSEYGLYNTVASTISLLSILRLGFNNSYIRYYSIYKKKSDKNAIFRLNGIFLTLFSIIGIISLMCGLFLMKNLNIVFSTGLTNSEYQIAHMLMLLLTINLSISFPMSVFSNIISANEKFVFLKLLDMLRTTLGPFVSLPLLLMGYGSVGMVFVTLVVSIVVDGCYLYYVLIKLQNKFIFKLPEKDIIKDIVIYTSFIALELIVDQINWNIDKILLARFKGTITVATYSVGYSLYVYYQSFSSSISGMFIPRIHKIINEIEDKQLQKKLLTNIFTKVGRIQFIILALVLSGCFFFGKFFIVNVWAGKEYSDSYYVALLLMFPATVALIQNIGIEIQRAQYKHKFRSFVYIVMAILNLVLSVILCQVYGAIGSAVGTAIALMLANGIIMNIYYQKKCNIDIVYFWINIFELSKGLIIPLVLGLVIIFFGITSVYSMIIGIMIYIISYVLSMWKFGLNNYEKDLFLSVVRKVKR